MRRESEFRYLQLAQTLREQILSGFIKPGEYLMSENELCKYYSMSRTSVRKSLEQLLKEGLIVKKVGQGTIVSHDVVPNATKGKVLRIFTVTPSHFFDIAMPSLIEQFQKENPNVEVKCLQLSAADFWESVNTSKELGLQPDLLLVSDHIYAQMEDPQQFKDMDEQPDGGAAIYPRLRNVFSREGRLKAMPVTFSTVFLAYNPELFRRCGVPEPSEHWTKEDFLSASKKLTMDTNGDQIPDVYGLSLSTSLSRWPVFALQNGVNFKATNMIGPLARTFKFLHELIYIHRVATQLPYGVINSEAFMKEKAAMVLTTSIEIAGWVSQEMRFEPKVASLPFGDSKNTMLIANAFMIPQDSTEPELARRFVQKAVQPEVQEGFSQSAGFISVIPSINERIRSTALLESLHIHQDVIANSYFRHELFDDINIIDEMEAEMMLYWAGLYSADEMAGHMQRILTSASIFTP